MSEYIWGAVSGVILIFIVWVVYLEIRVQFIQDHLNTMNEKQEFENATKAISGLSKSELDALVAKDLGGSAKPS